MLSCDPNNLGCDGDEQRLGQKFLQTTGVPLDECLPYKSGISGVAGKCPKKCVDGTNPGLKKSFGFVDVCTDEESIKNAIFTFGTIQTTFTIYQDFLYYINGIYQHKSQFVVGEHAVVFVGYGEENGVKFWKCRNSWGDWGENGYFRILRGINECAIEGQCFQVKVR